MILIFLVFNKGIILQKRSHERIQNCDIHWLGRVVNVKSVLIEMVPALFMEFQIHILPTGPENMFLCISFTNHTKEIC